MAAASDLMRACWIVYRCVAWAAGLAAVALAVLGMHLSDLSWLSLLVGPLAAGLGEASYRVWFKQS